jgi:hypothetical protein
MVVSSDSSILDCQPVTSLLLGIFLVYPKNQTSAFFFTSKNNLIKTNTKSPRAQRKNILISLLRV